MASAIKNENEKKISAFFSFKSGGLVAINCVVAIGQLTLSILMDFPKHIDTTSMG